MSLVFTPRAAARAARRFLAVTMLTATAASHASAQVVISQFYGGGGNTNATFANDFVELFNRGGTTFTAGANMFSIQYASATGSFTNVAILPTFTLLPGQYFLLALSAGTAGDGAPLPAADATGSINLSATAGKLAFVNGTTALGAACTSPSILDLVGYGATATCFEGGAPAPGPSTNNMVAGIRLAAGCTDTNNNGADFVTGTPTPRNTQSTQVVCAGTGPTTPVPEPATIALFATGLGVLGVVTTRRRR